LKRRGLLLFFLLPFLGIFVIFLAASVLNRTDIRKRTEDLVRVQLEATAGILGTNIAHHIREGLDPAAILGLFAPEEDIYFLALLDNEKNVLAWSSQFEGYLPLSLNEARPGESQIFDSPVGRIFSTFTAVSPGDGETYILYLGYTLTSMEEMLARSRRTALLFFGTLALAGAILFRGISLLQSRYVEKTREAETERLEKERFREISAFTSGVAHEIKNPLNSLALLFELLLKRAPDGLRADLALGKAEIRNIGGIVDRFSDATKPIHIEPRPFSLGEALRLAGDAVAREEASAAARLRVLPCDRLAARGDRDLLVQAVINLVKNALEASDDSLVEVQARRRKKNVTIEVRDTGPGIPAEVLPRVFEPFFSTKRKGMGIGLYLAQRIVEAHGGTIEAAHREGGGTRFLVQIPGE
jgi:signal transduction histidine kinase